jgi:hypothetical protein
MGQWAAAAAAAAAARDVEARDWSRSKKQEAARELARELTRQPRRRAVAVFVLSLNKFLRLRTTFKCPDYAAFAVRG